MSNPVHTPVHDDEPPILRKLTHEQARMEQRLYWSRKTVAERLEACAALTRRLHLMRGIDIDEQQTDLRPRRVPRRRS